MTMAFTARPTSTNMLTQLVNQTNHMFTLGQVVVYNHSMSKYVLAQADTAAHCAGAMIVSIIIGPSSFYVTQEGYILNPSWNMTTGVQYYLDPSVPGNLTDIAPVAIGETILACFVADSPTSGFFFGGSGTELSASSSFPWTTITANQTLAANTGYFINGSGALNALLLPPSINPGETIILWDFGGNGFTLTQNNTQFCYFGPGVTSTGTPGTIVSTQKMAKLTIVCQTVFTTFLVNPDYGSFSTT